MTEKNENSTAPSDGDLRAVCKEQMARDLLNAASALKALGMTAKEVGEKLTSANYSFQANLLALSNASLCRSELFLELVNDFALAIDDVDLNRKLALQLQQLCIQFNLNGRRLILITCPAQDL